MLNLPSNKLSSDELRESLKALVHALIEASKVDGRLGIDGHEYNVSPLDAEMCVFRPEWAYEEPPLTWSIEYLTDTFRTYHDIHHRVHRIFRGLKLTIDVDWTHSVWHLFPLGTSVPGQRSIEHQAGSPKPEPEIIHPEPEDYDDDYYDR